MDALAAFHETIALAHDRGPPQYVPDPHARLRHLEDMLARAEVGRRDGTMSYGKLCRWLGYAQGVVVSCYDSISLEDIKEINGRHAD